MHYRSIMNPNNTVGQIPCQVRLPLMVEVWLRQQAETRHTTKSELIRKVLNVISETDTLDYFLSPAMSFATTAKLITQKAQAIQRLTEENATLRVQIASLERELAECRKKTTSSSGNTLPNSTQTSQSSRSIEGLSSEEIDRMYEQDHSWKYTHQ